MPKRQKFLKRTLSCSIMQIVFKNQINISNVFRFKVRLPYDLMSCVVDKFQFGRCNAFYYGETDRHLKIRWRGPVDISQLTFKKIKLSAECSIRDDLLLCVHDPSFNGFTTLTQGTNNFLLEIKESLLLKRNKPIQSKSISSAPLFLFGKV